MCGIVGAFSAGDDPGSVGRPERFLKLLQHRGPDQQAYVRVQHGEGRGWLGHTRLKIIDLSDTAGQPMWSADGRHALLFNGEIYNYRELRQELRTKGVHFRTDSDSEVLLHAWLAWGADVLPRLVGMFAFVIYDREMATLHGARDAFGIKPLYYRCGDRDFSFASESSVLCSMGMPGSTMDWQTAYDYLVHGNYDSGERTFFQGILALPAAYCFRYELNTFQWKAWPWWKPTIAQGTSRSVGDAADELRTCLLDSVRLHLRSDVPLGAALSGGLDSSAIVGCMRHLEPDAPIHTFSFIAPGSSMSEERWVDLMNGHVGAMHHKVGVKPGELGRDLEDLIATQGEPFGSTSIYAQYRVFQLAREHGMTVTLDGQGADELCGGYAGYPGPRTRSLLDQGRWLDAAQFLRSWGRWPDRVESDGWKAAAAEYMGDTAYQAARRMNGGNACPEWLDGNVLSEAGIALRFPREIPHVTDRGRRLPAELARSLHGLGLQGLLRHGDRNSMRFSIESRVPFLTVKLADFLLALPEEYLVANNGETKHLLRKAMRGLVPQAILERRDKIGFATPEHAWLLNMAPQIREWLRVPLGVPFLRQQALLQAFDSVVAGQRPYSWQVWRWVNFARWHATHFPS